MANRIRNNANNNNIQQTRQPNARAFELHASMRKIEETVTFPENKNGRELAREYLDKKIEAEACIDNNKGHLLNMSIAAKQQFNKFLIDNNIVQKRDNEGNSKLFDTIDSEVNRIVRIEKREKMVAYLKEKNRAVPSDYHAIETAFKQLKKEEEIQKMLPLIQRFYPGSSLNTLLENDSEYQRILLDSRNKQTVLDQRALVQKSRPQMTLQQIEALDEEEFAILLGACEEEEEARKDAKDALDELFDLVVIPDDKKGLYEVNFTGSSQKKHAISVKNVVMGYSIYNILHSLDIVKGDYQGDLEFHLTVEEMIKFRDDLLKTNQWAHDFRNIVRAFLDNGRDPIENHVELGQKPVAEIFKDNAGWSRGALSTLGEMPGNTQMLLLGVVSLNLKNHSNRDKIKQEFLKLYSDAKLISHNKDAKRFLDHDPYRTNLGVPQVQQIAPQLNKLIKFKQLVTEFIGIKDYYQALEALKEPIYEMPNELSIMKQYKIGVLMDIMNAVSGQTYYQEITNKVDTASDIGRLEGVSLELCQNLISRYTGIKVKTRPIPYEFTQNDINEVVYQNAPFFDYRGARHKNVVKLMTTLQASDGYKKALENNPDLNEGMKSFIDNFVARLNTYHTLSNTCPNFGKPPLDRAVQLLEMFAVKIIDQNRSKITDASVEKALVELVGQQGAEAHGACNGGFFGRINISLLCLQTSGGSEIEDHLNEFKQGCINQAFQRVYGGNWGSSHLDAAKEDVARFFQAIPGPSKTYDQIDANLRKAYLNEYTPVELYHSMYEFLGKKFWELNNEGDDEAMYRFFGMLGFPDDRESLDKMYRVNGDKNQKWQYAFFQQDLPSYLVNYLIKKEYLFKRNPQNDLSFRKDADPERLIPVEHRVIPQAVVNQQPNNNNNQPREVYRESNS